MSDPTSPLADVPARFSDEARRAVYDAIALRRDVRQFRVPRPDVAADEVGDDTLLRILGAAHLAPSVGFSQPWGFVVVRDRAVRARIRESFLRCREAEAARFPEARRAQYLAYRLEGILDAAVNVCVAVDLRSRGEAILGTTAQPEAVRASACCAVQNLWLAARVEGLGVGWVSIVEPAVLRAELRLPPGVEPIAYLCVGHPIAFRPRPMLEETGWLDRRSLESAIHRERWTEGLSSDTAAAGVVDVPRAGAAPPSAAERPPTRPSAAERPPTRPSAAERPPTRPSAARAGAAAHQRALTKPPGSLGRLEEIAIWLADVTGRFPCAVPERASVAVFAADHGVVVEAVSAYSSQLTASTVCNIMAGGAAINVLARRHRIDLTLVDVGIAGDLSSAPTSPEVALRRLPVRAGTRNLRVEPAMTRDEALAAIAVGAKVADECAAAGVQIVGTGEVGIGNTTAGAALACALTGSSPASMVGSGTGIDDATRARKIAVVADALNRSRAEDPVAILASLGGFELAATVGFILRAAEHRLPVVLDGFLAGASALVARAMRPEVTRFLLASHASAEAGSLLVLEALELTPLLSLGMRLGEGTGAVLAIELVRSAVALQSEMTTFATAGVVRRRDPA
jgi:nicotinate-nucleotide--dimethylbenzimidazole phosphoribosyltransferase